MSISIITAPIPIASAYRPVIFKVASSVSTPELQIKGEIYGRNNITDPLALLAIKYEKKYLGNNYFIFDLASVLRSLLSFDRITTWQAPGVITPNQNSIIEYQIKFTEVYYGAGTGIPVEYAIAWSNVLRAVNTIPQHTETQSLVDYIIDGSQNGLTWGA